MGVTGIGVGVPLRGKGRGEDEFAALVYRQRLDVLIAQAAMLLRAAQATVGSDVDHTEAVKWVEAINGVELS